MDINNILKIGHEAIAESVSVLDSEELVNKAYEGLLAILSLYPDRGNSLDVYQNIWDTRKDVDPNRDLFTPLITGIYIPGSKRLYWCGRVDVNVDLVVAQGSVYTEPNANSDYSYTSVSEMTSFPKYIYNGDPNPRHLFRVTKVCFYKKAFHRDFGKIGQFSAYFSVSHDGAIYKAVNTKSHHLTTLEQYQYGPGVINLMADRLYIWNIETQEPNTSFGFPAIVTFGVEPEMVKSLVYARSLPLTESGRKRPILHWVRSHQRRLKDGIEIDIDKFLRGITEFDMGGLGFRVSRPIKNHKQRTQKQEIA